MSSEGGWVVEGMTHLLLGHEEIWRPFHFRHKTFTCMPIQSATPTGSVLVPGREFSCTGFVCPVWDQPTMATRHYQLHTWQIIASLSGSTDTSQPNAEMENDHNLYIDRNWDADAVSMSPSPQSQCPSRGISAHIIINNAQRGVVGGLASRYHHDVNSGPHRDEDVLVSLQLLAFLGNICTFDKPCGTSFHPASVNLPNARHGWQSSGSQDQVTPGLGLFVSDKSSLIRSKDQVTERSDHYPSAGWCDAYKTLSVYFGVFLVVLMCRVSCKSM